MENSIIIRTENHFKSKELNKATADLAKAFGNIEGNRKQVCIILAKVEKGKMYKEDGFNSLKEYAEVIGIDKSTAHKMENAGRLLLSEVPTVQEFAQKADWSKVAMLASEDVKEVEKAINDGELSADSKQKEVKAWKDANKAKKVASGKVKALVNYNVFIRAHGPNRETFQYSNKPLEAIPELDGFTLVKVPRPWYLSPEWKEYRIAIPVEVPTSMDETEEPKSKPFIMEVMFTKSIPGKKSIKEARNMTKEEILAQIAELQKLAEITE